MSDLDEQARQPKAPEEEADTATQRTSLPALGTPTPDNSKNIIVCCDGTGNEFGGLNAKGSNSNVVKLYTALKLNKSQIAYYHPGVGTMGDPTKEGLARAWSVVTGLAFGTGFEENVLDAYRYLMQHYSSGDRVYIFGFSRGAYTARALAGLLHGYGLLCRGNESHIPYAWREYTRKLKKNAKETSIPTDFSFRDTFAHKDFIIHFVGFWDTVSSVGWISDPLRLLHLAQNPSIIRGRHAISIDERRTFYQDNLWGPPVEVQYPEARRAVEEFPPQKLQDIVQVWFAGVHSDVGGSYKQTQSGLSDITLKWMLQEAYQSGICLDPGRCAILLGEPFDLKAADPCNRRSEKSSQRCKDGDGGGPEFDSDPHGQLALLYKHPNTEELHDSFTMPWWPLEIFPHRYYDRDDVRPMMRIPLGSWRRIPRDAIVHPSVFARLGTGYSPKNIRRSDLDILLKSERPPDTIANLEGFFRFTPKHSRKNPWRETWYVVFLVTLVEVTIGLALLWLVLKGLSFLIDGALQIVGWLIRHSLLHWDLSKPGWELKRLALNLAPLCPFHSHWASLVFWSFIIAFILVVGGFIRSLLRIFKFRAIR